MGALVLLLAAASTSQAVLLSDLLNGGSITAGDKLFDNWALIRYDTSDPARSFNAGNITVTALDDGGMNPGPGLHYYTPGNLAELIVWGDGNYSFIDLMFTYRVSVIDPAVAITGASLSNMGAALTSDPLSNKHDSGAFIRETVDVAPIELTTEYSMLDSMFTYVASDSDTFKPQSFVWVTTNILIWSTELNDMAGMGSFDQRFSQSPVGVPEPGMLALLAFGGVALLRFKRN
jgi:hypothetical protein